MIIIIITETYFIKIIFLSVYNLSVFTSNFYTHDEIIVITVDFVLSNNKVVFMFVVFLWLTEVSLIFFALICCLVDLPSDTLLNKFSNMKPTENSMAKNPKRIDITTRANEEVNSANNVIDPITLIMSGASIFLH